MNRDETRADAEAERLQALIDRLTVDRVDGHGDRSSIVGGRPSTIDRMDATQAVSPGRTGRDDLAELAHLARVLETSLPVSAPAPFKADLQVQLQELMLERSRRRTASGLLRWLPKLAAAVVAVALAFGSAVAASADSLPGHALYPVKRAVEDTRLALTLDPNARARLRYEMALCREAELEGLLTDNAEFDMVVIEDLIAARTAASVAAGEVNDAALLASIDAGAGDAGALVRQALERLPQARRPQAGTASAWSGSDGTATPELGTPVPATPRPIQDSEESRTGDGVEASAPTSGAVPAGPARAPSPTAPATEARPSVRPHGPSTPVAPGGVATTVPPTARPTDPPTSEPTLDRGAQREATVRAGTQVAPEHSGGGATSEAVPTTAHPPGS